LKALIKKRIIIEFIKKLGLAQNTAMVIANIEQKIKQKNRVFAN